MDRPHGSRPRTRNQAEPDLQASGPGPFGEPFAPIDEFASPDEAGPIVVLMPVFNDWESLALLLPALDESLAARGFQAEVLLIDDGSPIEPDDDPPAGSYPELPSVALL